MAERPRPVLDIGADRYSIGGEVFRTSVLRACENNGWVRYASGQRAWKWFELTESGKAALA